MHVLRCALSLSLQLKEGTHKKQNLDEFQPQSYPLAENRQETVEEESQHLTVVEVLTVLITMVQNAGRDLSPSPASSSPSLMAPPL